MPLTRRKFLRFFLLPLSASILSILLLKSWLLTSLRDWLNKLLYPALEKVGTGNLKPNTLQCLLKVTETLVGASIEKGHYETYFEWRAENLPGYQNLYKKFAAVLDQMARQSFHRDFTNCELAMCKSILREFFPSGRFYTLKTVLFNSENYILFHDHIIQEILKIFSHTDAWILMGYKHWPGEARGLEQYRRKPF